MSLFPDFANVCTKAPEDFAALLAMRIAQRREADERRLEAEREKIRAEEAARAQANHIAEASKMVQASQPDRVADAGKTIDPAVVKESLTVVATIKLGEICARLGFTVTADFLASLGVSPVAHEKNAKLYDANKFPTICRLISEHVMALAFRKAA
jgi:hypothetical protein